MPVIILFFRLLFCEPITIVCDILSVLVTSTFFNYSLLEIIFFKIFLQLIMHDWGDEECARILKNCKKAIKERNGGKVIIMDAVLEAEGDGMFDEMKMVSDLTMLTLTGGKERTEEEWKKVLKQGGFPRYKITNIPALLSIIEAYPE